MTKRIVVVSILATLAACASPDERRVEESGVVLGAEQAEALGASAGRAFAAARVTTSTVLVLRGHGALPADDLFSTEARARLLEGFRRSAGVDVTERLVPDAEELDLTWGAVVRRGREVRVVDYVLGFQLWKGEQAQWLHGETLAAEGKRPDLAPHSLSGKDLDGLATQAADDIARGLADRRVQRVHVKLAPEGSRPPPPGVEESFLVRLLGGLAGHRIGFTRREGSPSLVVSVSLERTTPALGAETHLFVVEVFDPAAPAPWKHWERSVTKSGP